MSEAAVMELERAVEWLDREIERITGRPERAPTTNPFAGIKGFNVIEDERVPKNIIGIAADTEQATESMRQLSKSMRKLSEKMSRQFYEFNKVMTSSYARGGRANPQSYHGPRGGRLTGR